MFGSFRTLLAAGLFLALARGSMAQSAAVKDGWADGEAAIKRFTIAPDLKVELFAAEPMLLNPVALSIDEKGRVFVVETFRLHAGVTDIRFHMDWLNTDLACRTTEDLANELKYYLGADIRLLTNNSEKVQLIEDRDGDGKADHSTVFAEGFNSIVDGIAAGVLARKGDVYFANIPNLWLLRDTKGTGQADYRESLHYGFGVRTSFLGHDLHGLCMGPDGKLYFSVGDRGFNVKTSHGAISNPDSGGVLRCNPDGSDLEMFAYGLRNPQGLVFDQYGNLFTGDNNSDSGDQARWVYVVEGGDSGWRVGFQSLEAPHSRGPWNSEKMWHPQNDDQPAYIVPPVTNITDGPSGVCYYPGVGLPARYDGHFFLSDFKGSTMSRIHSFAVEPKGASFSLVDRTTFLSGLLMTDVKFGPDSALYITDWVEGWNMPFKGRIYKMFDAGLRNGPLVLETKKLIGEGMDQRSPEELAKLLFHPDQRVRQEAQFALADKGLASKNIFAAVAGQTTNQIARLHAIWGFGQIARVGADNLPLDSLIPLLHDGDSEIRAQAAHVLGDARLTSALEPLMSLAASDTSARVRFFSTMALGKIGDKKAVAPILQMLRANKDGDPFLRHAGVMALVTLGETAVSAAAHDDSSAVRMAALLAMRRSHRAGIAMFLSESDARLVTEAARAINDEPINDAMPSLAALVTKTNYAEPLFSRVLNANFRLGTAENAEALAAVAARPEVPTAMRADALDLLAQWAEPSGRDHIVNLWRPLRPRDGQVAVKALTPNLDLWLRHSPPAVQLSALKAARSYVIEAALPIAFELLTQTNNPPDVRVEALTFMALLRYEKLVPAVRFALADKAEEVRKIAATIVTQLNPADATPLLASLLENGSIGERQNALLNLGTVRDSSANDVILRWVYQMKDGQLPPELNLELYEAVVRRNYPPLTEAWNKVETEREANDPLSSWRLSIAGGDVAEGKKLFFERQDVACSRCHKIGNDGGNVGPPLTGIGARQSRDYILESIVFPNKTIAAGFESVMVTMKNGTVYAGIAKKETDTELVLNTPEEGLVTIKKADIAKREHGLSAMPEGLAKILPKRDLRNLIEFLATQK